MYKYTLHTQTDIDIDMSRFIENLLKIYRMRRPLADGYFSTPIIASVIEKMTLQDPYDYDNGYQVMQTVMKNAIIHATEWHYAQTEIDMLEELLELLH